MSAAAVLDSEDSSCERRASEKKKGRKKIGRLFGGCFSGSSRQNLSGRTQVNQQCMNLFQTLTGGVQVREKSTLICLLLRDLDKQRVLCSTPGLLSLIVKFEKRDRTAHGTFPHSDRLYYL